MNNLMIISSNDTTMIKKIERIKETDELTFYLASAGLTIFTFIPIGLFISSIFGISKIASLLISYFSTGMGLMLSSAAIVFIINSIKEKISLKMITKFNLDEKLLEYKNLLYEEKNFTTEELGILCRQYLLFVPFIEKAYDYNYNKDIIKTLFHDCQNKLIQLMIQNKEIYSILLLGYTHPTTNEENAYLKDLYEFLNMQNKTFEKMSGINLLETDEKNEDIKDYNIDFLNGCCIFYDIKYNDALGTNLTQLLQYTFYKKEYEEILQMQYNFKKLIKLKKERFAFDFNKDNIIENLFFQKG